MIGKRFRSLPFIFANDNYTLSWETGNSPLRLFAVAAPNGNPQPVAQKIIHILSTGRRFVLHTVALRHDSHDCLGRQPASRVIVQMEIDGFHMGVVLQKSGEGHRQLAFLDLFLRLVHPGKGQQIVPPPVDPVQLTESGIGHDINGALAQMDRRILHAGGQGKGKVLITAA